GFFRLLRKFAIRFQVQVFFIFHDRILGLASMQQNVTGEQMSSRKSWVELQRSAHLRSCFCKVTNFVIESAKHKVTLYRFLIQLDPCQHLLLGLWVLSLAEIELAKRKVRARGIGGKGQRLS